MKIKGTFFLIRKYLKFKFSIITILTYLSVLTPLLGVAVLIIVNSVMSGFIQDYTSSITDVESHITLYRKDGLNFDNFEKEQKFFQEKYQIKISPSIKLPSFVKKEELIFFETRGIMDNFDKEATKLKESIIAGEYKLGYNDCIIGINLANRLNLNIGDELTINFPERYLENLEKIEESDGKSINIKNSLTVTIRGVFMFRNAMYNDNLAFIHHYNASNMISNLDWAESKELSLYIDKPNDAESIAEKISTENQALTAIPWQKYSKYKNYISSVRKEKGMINFVLFFIMIGASITIATSLISISLQKTKEIGLLKAMGVDNSSIFSVFLILGGMIGIIGSILGLIAGLIVLEYRNQDWIRQLLWNENTYHLHKIPSLVNPTEIAIIMISSIFICIISALIPAILSASIKPISAISLDK